MREKSGTARRTGKHSAGLSTKAYESALYDRQVELVKLQRHLIKRGERVLVIIEGRDAAGKDGLIKRMTAHMAPRETRVVALGKPTEKDTTSWYFQRYVAHLPSGGEFVVFNRSWYNRAGVERVMGFCTSVEYERFMATVVPFETMLVRAGLRLFKYYLDISKAEQKERLAERASDPLTQWKISPIDKAAQRLWTDYSDARDAMLARTSHAEAPWRVVVSNDKKAARIAVLSDLLGHLSYPGKRADKCVADPETLFVYAQDRLGRLAH